jgi:hypothetical protein
MVSNQEDKALTIKDVQTVDETQKLDNGFQCSFSRSMERAGTDWHEIKVNLL